MTRELHMLLGATALGLVHLSAASFAYKAQVGNRYSVGPRDDEIRPIGVAGRLHRAQWNFLETYPLFAVCVLVVAMTERAGVWSAIGSAMYLLGRIAYLPLYAFGVPWVRTFSWNLATLGLVMVGVQLFM